LLFPIGYAEGIPFSCANNMSVMIHDRPYPVIGSICMNMMMVYLGDNPDDIQVGDDVVIFDRDPSACNHFLTVCERLTINPRATLHRLCRANLSF